MLVVSFCCYALSLATLLYYSATTSCFAVLLLLLLICSSFLACSRYCVIIITHASSTTNNYHIINYHNINFYYYVVVGTAYPIYLIQLLGPEAKCICTPDLTSLAVQGNSTTVMNVVCTPCQRWVEQQQH